jgi:hypothetical protein
MRLAVLNCSYATIHATEGTYLRTCVVLYGIKHSSDTPLATRLTLEFGAVVVLT